MKGEHTIKETKTKRNEREQKNYAEKLMSFLYVKDKTQMAFSYARGTGDLYARKFHKNFSNRKE